VRARRGRTGRIGVCVVVALVASACGLLGRGPGHGHGQHFEATGFFHTEQVGERWWLVTPDGHAFYSHGVNHAKPDPNSDRVTGRCPYCDAVAAAYPDLDAWTDATVDRLRSWGFNTISAWSDLDRFADRMPYTVLLNMSGGDDWFAPEFQVRMEDIAAEKVAPRRDDPNLVGYFLANEMRWGPDYRSFEPLLTDYLALPEGAPGRAVAEAHRGDPDGFLRVLAEHYYEVTTSAIRAVDPNHLVLGTRFISFLTPPEAVEAAADYLDVLSVNHYTLVPGGVEAIQAIYGGKYMPVTPDLAEFHEASGLPVLVSEYSVRAADTDVPNSWPPIYPTVPDQQARADAWAAKVAPLYAAPWVVGDHWFELVDQPPGGRRGDGEDNNFGVVSNADVPYATLTARMAEVRATTAPDRTVRHPNRCATWTRVGHGHRVRCAERLPSG